MVCEKPPAPTVMPVDHALWVSQLNLSNFVNTYCQFRDLQTLPDCRKVLIIGPGQGLDTQVLRWRGYQVTTFDIDDRFHPDVVGSVHEMKMFGDSQFDVVIASHVLEHLPVAFLDASLAELARIARFALVYLPVAGRHMLIRFLPAVRNIDVSVVIDLLPFWKTPDGVRPRYCEGQHFWELGLKGFRRRDVRRRLRARFEVLREYRNRDWLPSYNYVLRSKVGEKSQ